MNFIFPQQDDDFCQYMDLLRFLSQEMGLTFSYYVSYQYDGHILKSKDLTLL